MSGNNPIRATSPRIYNPSELASSAPESSNKILYNALSIITDNTNGLLHSQLGRLNDSRMAGLY